MHYLRMIGVALRLAWPYLLTPWRSPLLRWRMETYGVMDEQGRLLHADQINPKHFFRFISTRRKELGRFLRWSVHL